MDVDSMIELLKKGQREKARDLLLKNLKIPRGKQPED
jgi:hypothetical protein